MHSGKVPGAGKHCDKVIVGKYMKRIWNSRLENWARECTEGTYIH